MKKDYQKIADRRVRLGLLLAKIADENQVKVEREDLTNAIMAEARRYPGQEKQVFEYYTKNPQAVEAIEESPEDLVSKYISDVETAGKKSKIAFIISLVFAAFNNRSGLGCNQ